MQVANLDLTIGEYQVKAVPTGFFGLDGGAMFGTVPKVIWSRTNPPDEQNRIQMEARALLLKSKNRMVLIDTGNGSDFVAKYGEKLGTKFAEIYNVTGSTVSLVSSLHKAGVTPEQITDVVLTHLHFDHAGGATCANSTGQVVPTFPNATYYVQSANLKTAQAPNIREKASYLPANFQPLLERGVLKIIDGEIENLLPGISVLLSHGHTTGHQMVKISDGKQTLIYCGDVIPTSTHVRLPFVMGYDLRPLDLIGEKTQLLEKAAAHKWYLYFEHDPFCAAALIEKSGPDFQVTQRFHLD